MQSSNNTLSRPLGITIFAALALIIAAAYLYFDIVVLVMIIPDIESSAAIGGLLILLWGLGLLAAALLVGYGLLKGKKWSWLLLVGTLFFSIGISFIGIFGINIRTFDLIWDYYWLGEVTKPIVLETPKTFYEYFGIAVSVAVDSLILYYLYRPHVRRYFMQQIGLSSDI